MEEKMKNMLVLFLFTVLVIYVLKFLNWVWFEPKRLEKFLRKQGMRGNPYKFLFGDTDEIKSMYTEAESKTLGLTDDILPRIYPFIKKTVETHGPASFAWIGPKARICITDVELINIVLQKHTEYLKSFRKSYNKLFGLVLGGIGVYYGDEWVQSRMKLNPSFHSDRLKPKVPVVEASTEIILNQLRSKIEKHGSELDVFTDIEDFGVAFMTQFLFSIPLNAQMSRNCKHLREIVIMTKLASKPFNIPGMWYLPSQRKNLAQALAMEKEVRDSFMALVNERLNRRKAAGEQQQQSDVGDMLDVFLDDLYHGDVKDSVRKYVIDEAIGQCKMMFFAGIETTSNVLVWTLITLAYHQDWQARGREEVLRVLGDSKEITSDHLKQLKTVTMILKEILRLYPPVMEYSRDVVKDMKLGEYHIPKGTIVQLPIALTQRSTEIWGKDANEFNPDRFAGGNLKAASGQAAFLAFGGGPRICLGKSLAMIEGKVFLAKFLKTFSFELSPSYKHAPYAAFTVQPQYGVPLILRQL